MDTHAKEETDILLPCFPIRSSIEGNNLHTRSKLFPFKVEPLCKGYAVQGYKQEVKKFVSLRTNGLN